MRVILALFRFNQKLFRNIEAFVAEDFGEVAAAFLKAAEGTLGGRRRSSAGNVCFYRDLPQPVGRNCQGFGFLFLLRRVLNSSLPQPTINLQIMW